MTLPQLKRALLKRVNEEISVPFIGEDTEALIIATVLTPALERIPVRLLPLLLDATDGLTEAEFEKHVDDLADFANELVDIPYVAEALEGRLISMVLRSALSPLLKGSSV
jgi:hypothetical protein